MTLIRFCGTRGFIEESSRQHRMHSALLIVHGGKRLLLDFGANWEGRLSELHPDWIAITHAHPDHAFGLREGTARPVYLTRESYALLKHFPVSDFRIVRPMSPVRLGPFTLTAYPVVHSIRAPAVGFKVRSGGLTVSYNPDLIEIIKPERILPDVDVYVGDGASLTRPIVRSRDGQRFGHTTIRRQLAWCRAFGVPHAVFVHCGKSVVEMRSRTLQRRVRDLAGPDLDALVASDGMELVLSTKIV